MATRSGAEDAHQRYAAQMRFLPAGRADQERLAAASVAVVGCGALGAAVAEQLARAGIGRLRLIDRDIVETSNLQRQCLFAEEDAAAARPKAVAAARRLTAINSALAVDAMVTELTGSNAVECLRGATLVCDGTDNFATRHRINEACRVLALPWVFGACVGAYALSAPLPIDGPCFRCLQDALPAPGDSPTCETTGIIAPAVHVAAAWVVAETLKLLVGVAPRRELWAMDVWQGSFQRLHLDQARDPACRACSATADYPALAELDDHAVVLCGRGVVQVRYAAIGLAALARRIGREATDGVLRWHDGELTFTAFADGRVLVHGAASGSSARAAADRWLG